MFLTTYFANPYRFTFDEAGLLPVKPDDPFPLRNGQHNLKLFLGGTPDTSDLYWKSYVYLARAINGRYHGFYKLGISCKPQARRGTLRKQHGSTVEYASLLPTLGCYADRQLEASLHLYLIDQHIGREWFVLSDDDVTNIVSLEAILPPHNRKHAA